MGTNNIHGTFGQRVRAERERAGLSRNQLAARSGTTYSTIYNIEEGITKEPEFATRQALATALGVTPVQLSGNHGVVDEAEATRARAYQVFTRLQSRGIHPPELAELFESMTDEERDSLMQLARVLGGRG